MTKRGISQRLYYLAHKKEIDEWNKNYQRTHPEYRRKKKIATVAWQKKYPWKVTLSGIKTRIKRSPSYNDIKCTLTNKEIEFIWFRDKAHLLERPSIDRIDTYGNYTKDNCRFIELLENCARPKRKYRRKNANTLL